MKSALIVGAGAIGLNLGFKLKTLKSAIRVGLVARSNYQALLNQGYAQIKYPAARIRAEDVFRPDILYSFDRSNEQQQTFEKFDYIIITTKSLATEAISGLERYCNKDSLLVLAQNGINIEEPYLKKYPQLNIASSVVRCLLYQETLTSSSDYGNFLSMTLGLTRPEQEQDGGGVVFEKLKELAEILKQAGVTNAQISNDLTADRWEKMMFNGTFNSVCAILDLDMKGVLDAGLEDMIISLGHEIYEVGVRVIGKDRMCDRDAVVKIIENTQLKNSQIIPSTLQDVRKGKPIEYEALSGSIIRIADDLGIEVPNLKMVYMMLKGLNYRLETKSRQDEKL